MPPSGSCYPPNAPVDGAIPPPKWCSIPNSSKDALRDRMGRLYWEGVRREILLLVRTMRSWRQEQYAEVRGEDEELRAEDLLGFQTFVERAVGEGRRERDGFGKLRSDHPYAQISPLNLLKLFINYPRHSVPMPQSLPPNQDLPSEKSLVFCETCMRSDKHGAQGRSHLRKYEKRCILRETVTPTQSRQICICEGSGGGEGDTGGYDTLFAAIGGREHRQSCPIWNLKQRHEQAKIDELLHCKRTDNEANLKEVRRSRLSRINLFFPRNTLARETHGRGTQGGSTDIAGRRAMGWAAKSVPPRIPFGNIHMALMVGPIIIENGVEGSKRGARISIRDPPQLAMTTGTTLQEDDELCVSSKRKVFHRHGPHRKRRIKACMKQVVGGAFTGFFKDAVEMEIIDALVQESRSCTYDPMRARTYDEGRLRAATNRLVTRLQVLLGARVIRYFEVIASKLLTVELCHHMLTNDCQRFCANILDFKSFGSFLATTPTCRLHVPANPLYLVSFTCAPGSYDAPRRVRPLSKRDAPNGLTEEYLLRFRQYGHHDESDITDTLLEYWYDWGAFGGPLYKFQDLFPWDCTEAFRMGEGDGSSKCNRCNIARHVWSFPFDAWSMTQHHVLRERCMYSPPHGSTRKTLSDVEWMRNRLTILSALKALNTVAAAMTRTPSFRAACRWNRERNRLTPDAASRLDRIKLSGIHRAQPYSHHFERGKFHDCLLADWALLGRPDQIDEYEKLRDYRADEAIDVAPPPPRAQSRSRRQQSRDRPEGDNPDNLPAPDFSQEDREETQEHSSERHLNDPESEYDEYGDAMELEYEAGGLLPDGFGGDVNDAEGGALCKCDSNEDSNWRDDQYNNFDGYGDDTNRQQRDRSGDNRAETLETRQDDDSAGLQAQAADLADMIQEIADRHLDDGDLTARFQDIIGCGGNLDDATDLRARFEEALAIEASADPTPLDRPDEATRAGDDGNLRNDTSSIVDGVITNDFEGIANLTNDLNLSEDVLGIAGTAYEDLDLGSNAEDILGIDTRNSVIGDLVDNSPLCITSGGYDVYGGNTYDPTSDSGGWSGGDTGGDGGDWFSGGDNDTGGGGGWFGSGDNDTGGGGDWFSGGGNDTGGLFGGDWFGGGGNDTGGWFGGGGDTSGWFSGSNDNYDGDGGWSSNNYTSGNDDSFF
ncbi:hypothetical protein FGG08_000447 [Glutinoglossum americanum]|uniref:Uncharacterized protein n=1 Tax=Glutinoglossum americanum TaxID=1670608 RepID=A0A9P8I3T2_9PEZI|nr:hypothetical protein FGG08_000447 [Glutinoglossum americanum]